MIAQLRTHLSSLQPWQCVAVLAVAPLSAILAFALLWAFTRKRNAAVLKA